MLERPKLSDEKIISCLQDKYGLFVEELTFLPIGNDIHSSAFKVHTNKGEYFLKVRSGEFYEASVAVPRYLQDQGIQEVLAPLPNKDGGLWETLDEYSLVLFPFVEAKTAMEVGMNETQWREFGKALRRIHSIDLPTKLRQKIKRERFSSKWLPLIPQIQVVVDAGKFHDSYQKTLAVFWRQKQHLIERIFSRINEVGKLVTEESLEFVLCHTDIHQANILIDQCGEIHIIDWDDPLFAPKERDIMFFADERGPLFYEGYWKEGLNQIAMEYYGLEWLVGEIAGYGERIFLVQDGNEETKQNAVDEFMDLFQAKRRPGFISEADWCK